MGARSTNPTQSFFDDFFRSGTDAVSPVPPPVGSATGGNINGQEPGNGFKYHTYTTTGASTFVVSGGDIPNCQIFVVGGGGSGGRADAGGGGGGGIAYATGKTLTAGTYPVTVGAGGAGIPPSSGERRGNDGDDSTFVAPGYTITGQGGGAGGGYPSQNGNPGGSGGGNRGHNGNTVPASQPTANPGIPNLTNYGNPGGGAGGSFGGGGGGSAAAGGSGNGSNTTGGNGGNGQPFPAFAGSHIGVPALTPLDAKFGGGGGGGGSPPGAGGSGGAGGGGRGGNSKPDTSPQMYGFANSGGGSGGAGTTSGQGHGESFPAGSGIVVIRYPVS